MRQCAEPLGLDALQAAHGIVEIANAHMIGAMRLISVQRGYDPRHFVLVAFGGAGPLHANALARDLDIPTVLIPPSPGIASALGMLMTDIKHEFVTTRRQVLVAAATRQRSTRCLPTLRRRAKRYWPARESLPRSVACYAALTCATRGSRTSSR